jgi:hypothetical protein
LRPALNLTHRHDVDAVLVVADGKADEVTEGDGAAAAGLRPSFIRDRSVGNRRSGLAQGMVGDARLVCHPGSPHDNSAFDMRLAANQTAKITSKFREIVSIPYYQ